MPLLRGGHHILYIDYKCIIFHDGRERWRLGKHDEAASPGLVSRFGAVRFPAGRAETAPCDGVCLRDVIRRKADKSPELAVEPSKRRPALTATHEAHPSSGGSLSGVSGTGSKVQYEEDSAGRFHRMRIQGARAILSHGNTTMTRKYCNSSYV